MADDPQELTDEEAAALNEQLGPDEGEQTPEPEPQPEPQPEPDPEPQGVQVDDAVMEKRFAAAGRASVAYAKKIGDIFEEQAVDLLPCPLCPEAHKGFVNKHDAGRVPEIVSQATMMFCGFATEVAYEQDPTTDTCRECGGHGKTRTGSRVVGNETHKCVRCNGYGFVPPPVTGQNGASLPDVNLFPAGDRPDALEGSDRDPSGEPRILPDGRENPNFGKWPQFKVQVAPWGTTAGLVAQDAVTA